MPIPKPEVGMVISYSYLWRYERDGGREEGRKNRPCVIVLAVEEHNGSTRVTVAPITHRTPVDARNGVAIPPKVKAHLGLDAEASWVIVSEVNQFTWPGYDLNPVDGSGRYDYGFLPPTLFASIKAAMMKLVEQKRVRAAKRD